MSEKLVRIKNRYDTDANWNKPSAAVLQGGEIGVSDSGDIILGNNEYNRKMSMIEKLDYEHSNINGLFNNQFFTKIVNINNDYEISSSLKITPSLNEYNATVTNETIVDGNGNTLRKIIIGGITEISNFLKTEDGRSINIPSTFYKEIHVDGVVKFCIDDVEGRAVFETTEYTSDLCNKTAYISGSNLIMYVRNDMYDSNEYAIVEINYINIIPNIKRKLLYKGLNCITMNENGIDTYPIKENDSSISLFNTNNYSKFSNSAICDGISCEKVGTNYEINITVNLSENAKNLLNKIGINNLYSDDYNGYKIIVPYVYNFKLNINKISATSNTIIYNTENNTIILYNVNDNNYRLYNEITSSSSKTITILIEHKRDIITNSCSLDLHVNGFHYPIFNHPNELIKINHPSEDSEWFTSNIFDCGTIEIHVPGFLPIFMCSSGSTIAPLIEATNANVSSDITIENAEYGYFSTDTYDDCTYMLVYHAGTYNIGNLPVYVIPHYSYKEVNCI